MIESKKEKGFASDLIITSIGACIAIPEEKKKDPCVMVAYAIESSKEISCIKVDFLPKGRLHSRETIMDAVKAAEKVKNITYTDAQGRAKDVYFCRSGSGKITDVVERDYDADQYKGDISEILSGQLRFLISNMEEIDLKSEKAFSLKIIGANENLYAANTYEYAMVNAYNACLLGRVFEREELCLETKDKKRVKIVVRPEKTAYMEEDILCIKPIFHDDGVTVDHYLTEEFNYIDGQTSSCRAYEIKYTHRNNDYNLVRA
jgi:hypothetical protein